MKVTWRRVRKIWIICGLTSTVLFSGWMLLGFRAQGFEEGVLTSGSGVTVAEDSEKITFKPLQQGTSALLFFPGGLVDPKAYGPLARQVAEQGYLSIIVKLPFRTAWLESMEVESIDRALAAIRLHPDIKKWIVAGHSKGGMIAARFTRDHSGTIVGSVLIGTTGPKDFDLSQLRLPVTKIYATNDGVATVEGVRRTAHLLPVHTRWMEIVGGNHAQFGWYGKQLGDGTATISREKQQAQTIQAILDALAIAAQHH